MLVVTGTRHSGTLFLSSTLQTAGLSAVSRKKVLAGATPPPGSMVAVPIPALDQVTGRADHVVGLVRPWRAYAMVVAEEDPDPKVPHEVQWWFENYRMVCSLMRSKSKFILLSHDRLLSRPETSVKRVLDFLGRPEAFADCLLLPAIAPSVPLYASRLFNKEQEATIDAYCRVVCGDTAMTRSTFQRMGALQDTLRRRFPQGEPVEPMTLSELQSRVPA